MGLGSDNIQQIKEKKSLVALNFEEPFCSVCHSRWMRFQIVIIYDEWFTILPKNFIKKVEFKIKIMLFVVVAWYLCYRWVSQHTIK